MEIGYSDGPLIIIITLCTRHIQITGVVCIYSSTLLEIISFESNIGLGTITNDTVLI